jgi:hypothetical protein
MNDTKRGLGFADLAHVVIPAEAKRIVTHLTGLHRDQETVSAREVHRSTQVVREAQRVFKGVLRHGRSIRLTRQLEGIGRAFAGTRVLEERVGAIDRLLEESEPAPALILEITGARSREALSRRRHDLRADFPRRRIDHLAGLVGEVLGAKHTKDGQQPDPLVEVFAVLVRTATKLELAEESFQGAKTKTVRQLLRRVEQLSDRIACFGPLKDTRLDRVAAAAIARGDLLRSVLALQDVVRIVEAEKESVDPAREPRRAAAIAEAIEQARWQLRRRFDELSRVQAQEPLAPLVRRAAAEATGA